MKKIIPIFLFILIAVPSVCKADTWFGDNDGNLFCGSPNSDIAWGYGGADILSGMAGDDILRGGFFSDGDKCYGGLGSDTFYGCGTTYAEADAPECATESESLASTDVASDNVIISDGQLTKVVGGSGTDVILFTSENSTVAAIKGSNNVAIKAGSDAALELTMSARPKVEAKNIQVVEKGSYSISFEALSEKEAEEISLNLFSFSSDGIIMQDPDSGKDIVLIDVDYVGFKNTPLIPVVTK